MVIHESLTQRWEEVIKRWLPDLSIEARVSFEPSMPYEPAEFVARIYWRGQSFGYLEKVSKRRMENRPDFIEEVAYQVAMTFIRERANRRLSQPQARA